MSNHKIQNDLIGLNQLASEGLLGTVDLVDAMHHKIISLGGFLSSNEANKTTGLTGFIYDSIRHVTALSSQGANIALSQFSHLLPVSENTLRKRDNWVSVLNGIMGDHLQDTQNPLAIAMNWYHRNQIISPESAAQLAGNTMGQPLLLIHGLCMNDLLWRRKGHDHGVALNQSNHMNPIYLRYNSGLSIEQNGQLLEQMLENFFADLPADRSIDALCHSMGGLVLRSALHIAQEKQAEWINRIGKIVFLGTPHQGAVLEKTGHLIDHLISINPYSAPLSKAINVRSQGIKDLRLGTVNADQRKVQLPDGIEAFAIAASSQETAHQMHQKWIGDGLVSVDSALGRHRHPDQVIKFDTQHQFIVENVSHMGLLSDFQVVKLLQRIF